IIMTLTTGNCSTTWGTLSVTKLRFFSNFFSIKAACDAEEAAQARLRRRRPLALSRSHKLRPRRIPHRRFQGGYFGFHLQRRLSRLEKPRSHFHVAANRCSRGEGRELAYAHIVRE